MEKVNGYFRIDPKMNGKCRTLDGKNRSFLKSFRMTEMMKVPKKRMIDIKKTFGTFSGFEQSVPVTVPFSA